MRYQKVVDILANAKKKIAELLTHQDDEHHVLKITSNLQREIDYLGLITGAGDIPTESSEKLGPAKTIGGEKINVQPKVSAADLQPERSRVEILREKVENSYNLFLLQESKFILAEYEDNVIRGVAKKAKMKVTKEDPETLTLEFIDEIKINIREQLRREEIQFDQKKAEELQDEEDSDPLSKDVTDVSNFDTNVQESGKNMQESGNIIPENGNNVSELEVENQLSVAASEGSLINGSDESSTVDENNNSNEGGADEKETATNTEDIPSISTTPDTTDAQDPAIGPDPSVTGGLSTDKQVVPKLGKKKNGQA